MARQGYTERIWDGECGARAASGGDPCVCCASLRDNGFVLGVTVMGVWLACLSADMQVCGRGWLLIVAGEGVAYVHVRLVASVHACSPYIIDTCVNSQSATDEG